MNALIIDNSRAAEKEPRKARKNYATHMHPARPARDIRSLISDR